MASGTSIKGELACCKVEQAAIEKGAIVSRPAIETRYDRIIDWQGKLYRAQVKYADGKSPGVVTVRLDSNRFDSKKEPRAYTRDEIDVVLVYVPKIERICWFGPEVFDARKSFHLRLEPAKNHQKKGCMMALDYFW